MALRHWFAAFGVATTGVAGLAGCASVPEAGQAGSIRAGGANSAAFRSTALPGVSEEAYSSEEDAIRAADLDAVVLRARQSGAGGLADGAVATVLIMDDVAASRPSDARVYLDALPDQYADGVRNLMEPWVLLAEKDKTGAGERAAIAAQRLPPRLGGVLQALIAEASGDLKGAAEQYDSLVKVLDSRPPGEGEASSMQEIVRQIEAPQTAQILYRAALVKHRLGDKSGAGELYGLVRAFAEDAPDIAANQARLGRGAPPMEPALDVTRGMGRWALFLSEEFGRTEGLSRAISDPRPTKDLVSPSSSLFNQVGVALDPSAHDWMIGAASVLAAADATEGALRILEKVPEGSVYAAEARLARAQIELDRRRDDAAAKAARAAQEAGGDRWSIAIGAGRILTYAGADADAVTVLTRAETLASSPKEKAQTLMSRALAHNFAGRTEAAVADARAAYAADPNTDIKIAMVGLLLEGPGDSWNEAVRVGRELLAEQPESVSRLNQLGYTLIHRPEGLDEGFRLLQRGVSMAEYDFAVIDSLGWAYYQYGDFEKALELIDRANGLSGEPVAEILDHLGDVYWRLRLTSDARKTWGDALKARPEARRRKQLEDKIANGLTTPAPVKRAPPSLEHFTPGQRSDL